MAIDYYGSFACPVRDKLTDPEILRMEKARNRAQSILEMKREQPQAQETPEAEWTVTLIVRGPNGPRESVLRLADLLEEAAPLQALSAACAGCPANFWRRDFGCGGAIHYPLSTKAEQWLMSRLPDDLKSKRGELLLAAIRDFGFDGGVVDTERSRSDIYESRAPASGSWGGLFARKTVMTSSQVLHMSFRVGSLAPAHARFIAFFLGFTSDDFEPDPSAANDPQPADDPTVFELKAFYAIAALAGAAQASVFIDA